MFLQKKNHSLSGLEFEIFLIEDEKTFNKYEKQFKTQKVIENQTFTPGQEFFESDTLPITIIIHNNCENKNFTVASLIQTEGSTDPDAKTDEEFVVNQKSKFSETYYYFHQHEPINLSVSLPWTKINQDLSIKIIPPQSKKNFNF